MIAYLRSLCDGHFRINGDESRFKINSPSEMNRGMEYLFSYEYLENIFVDMIDMRIV